MLDNITYALFSYYVLCYYQYNLDFIKQINLVIKIEVIKIKISDLAQILQKIR